jgi:HK97 family phage portal protein
MFAFLDKILRPAAERQKELRFQGVSSESMFSDVVPTPEPIADLARAYEAHVWCYACGNVIASNLAGIDFLPYRRDKGGQWMVYADHPFNELLRRPNPYMTSLNLKELTFLSLEFTGNAYWAFERDKSGKIFEVWPLPASQVVPVSSKTRLIDHYLYDVNGQRIRYEYNDILNFRYANLNSMVYGQGSLAAAKNAVISDLYAEAYNKYFFKNSGRPDAVLESDQTLQDDTLRRIRAAWKKMHEGAVNRGRTAILENGLKYKEINRTPKDLDFVLLRKLAREEVLAAFGVPPAMVGIFEYANYANTKEQIQIFWKQTLIPKIRNVEETLTRASRQLFLDVDSVFQADLAKVEALRSDEQARSLTARTYVDMGIPLNQVIDALDLPFDPVEDQSTDQRGIPKTVSLKTLSKNPEGARDMLWKAFDQKARKFEVPFLLSLRSFFRGQKRRVLSALSDKAGEFIADRLRKKAKPSEDDLVRVILDMGKETTLFENAVDRHIRGTYYSFAVSVSRDVDPNFNFNLRNPAALNFLKTKVSKVSREVNEATLEALSEAVTDSIQEAIVQGFSQSETIAQIADRIDDVYSFAVNHRAERIARTEVVSASNAGAMEGMRQTGVEKKEWLDSRDARVRDSHKELGGQVASLGEPFITGEGVKLMFPGDPEAEPGETVNCRCTLIPVVSRASQ